MNSLETRVLKKSSFKSFFSYNDLVNIMYEPTDPSSLGVIRLFFGLLMLIDISEERGGAELDERFGNPKMCHFPLFSFLKAPSFPYVAILYGIMSLGAFGVMIGYKFRLSAILFALPYWYILLLDKSFWNNHSYLHGIISILFIGTNAANYFSIDGFFDKEKYNREIPYWNYFILKFQFFMLYFLAGLKKIDMEWLEGYAMTDLGSHWVFVPFSIFLSTEQIDYLVVHWFGFFLDLTIGFWMLCDFTRPFAMIICAMFHLMNSRMFSIGMFPYVCLVTMPLFCKESWPRKLTAFVRESKSALCSTNSIDFEEKTIKNVKTSPYNSWKRKSVVGILLFHCVLQGFLPYSHFITKGYNNWSKGIYGYSWDMMVHSWDTLLVIVKIVDNNSGNEYFIDPNVWTLNDRWTTHADMCLEYAECIRKNVIGKDDSMEINDLSENISIYIDVWCSLNGRFQQRMFDPNYDLLKADWSPFKNVEWLLPLLTEKNNLRYVRKDIMQHVYSWSNYTDVIFVSDFPGLTLENFIPPDLKNVTLFILNGSVVYEIENEETLQSTGVELKKGQHHSVNVDSFHKIHTIGTEPSSYLYTYVNVTKEQLKESRNPSSIVNNKMYSAFPLVEDISSRLNNFVKMMSDIYKSILFLVFNKEIN